MEISVQEEPQAIWSFWLFIKKTSIIFFMWVDLIFESFSWKEKNATAIGAEVVCDQNQLLIWGTKTKVQFEYWYSNRTFWGETSLVIGSKFVFRWPI